MQVDKRIAKITRQIIERSTDSRGTYLTKIRAAVADGPHRVALACGNLAHAFAANDADDKSRLSADKVGNLAIVTSFNDMLSAHQPFEKFPDIIKQAAHDAGGVAQVAAGVPAMCDGVTQGQPGMELSLFSRDIIAMSTAIGLSHNMFDAGVYLGVCDKIVPGLMIGALTFGHLPAVFVPAGPMTSGLPNDEKVRIRQLYAEGKIDRDELLKAESKSYHGPGTCTFYGTANSNQMLMEILGLHLPGSSFVNPGTKMRDALTAEAAKRALAITALGNEFTPIGEMIDEKSIVNGVIGLLATGGSTNHTLHLLAIARAAGIVLKWDDIARLSDCIPLIARVYPNGLADVNHFHAAGGMGYLIKELLGAGLLHEDVGTIVGKGMKHYLKEPKLGKNENIEWVDIPQSSGNKNILATAQEPFSATGGLKMLAGNLGEAVIKISAVKEERHVIEAPVKVFKSQNAMSEAFKAGELEMDFIAVILFQGPRANGMPELHKLTPALGVLQDRGFKVALLTDGRMSGASGKVPAAIHLTPEALDGGPIARLRDGDMVRIDAIKGSIDVLVNDGEWDARTPLSGDHLNNMQGFGRELFANFRSIVGPANEGASVL